MTWMCVNNLLSFVHIRLLHYNIEATKCRKLLFPKDKINVLRWAKDARKPREDLSALQKP